ncbi:OMA1 [Sanghuangporus vaninii]
MTTVLGPIARHPFPLERCTMHPVLPTLVRPLTALRRNAPFQPNKRDLHGIVPRTSSSVPHLDRSVLGKKPSIRIRDPHNKFILYSRYPIQWRFFSEFRDKPSPEQAEPSLWSQLDPRAQLAAFLLVLAALYYASHLERVPETGRWRFMAVSEEVEVQLQDDQYKDLLKEFRGRILPPDHPLTQQIESVVSTILEANGLGIMSSTYPESLNQKVINGPEPDVEIWDPDSSQTETDLVTDDSSTLDAYDSKSRRKWNLLVVADDNIVNAMVVNGNIVVFTGILPVAHDIDGLAAVLSHEIAHVVARHLSEKLSARVLIEGLFYALRFLGFDVGLGPIVVDFLYHLPNSRAMELEADKIGLQLAARACFDPRGAVSMQTRLAKLEAQHSSRLNLSFLQTHPAGVTRVKLLKDALPEAFALRAASSTCAQLEDDFDAFRAMASNVRNEQEVDLPK